jgi:hypothetical protein
MPVLVSLLLSKYEYVTKNSQKKHQHVHIVFNERGEGWWIYMTHCAKNQILRNAPKLMTSRKKVHINLMGQSQCISNPSKVKKPFNLGNLYSLSS